MATTFIGNWWCQFYRWSSDTIEPCPPFPMQLKRGKGNTLTGSFPTPEPGRNATMSGTLSNDGKVWAGKFEGVEKGTILFVLSDDAETFYGAWVAGDHPGPPQPWWGNRKKGK